MPRTTIKRNLGKRTIIVIHFILIIRWILVCNHRWKFRRHTRVKRRKSKSSIISLPAGSLRMHSMEKEVQKSRVQNHTVLNLSYWRACSVGITGPLAPLDHTVLTGKQQACANVSEHLVTRLWSTNQQHQHFLGAFEKSTLDLLNQNLQVNPKANTTLLLLTMSSQKG